MTNILMLGEDLTQQEYLQCMKNYFANMKENLDRKFLLHLQARSMQRCFMRIKINLLRLLLKVGEAMDFLLLHIRMRPAISLCSLKIRNGCSKVNSSALQLIMHVLLMSWIKGSKLQQNWYGLLGVLHKFQIVKMPFDSFKKQLTHMNVHMEMNFQ